MSAGGLHESWPILQESSVYQIRLSLSEWFLTSKVRSRSDVTFTIERNCKSSSSKFSDFESWSTAQRSSNDVAIPSCISNIDNNRDDEKNHIQFHFGVFNFSLFWMNICWNCEEIFAFMNFASAWSDGSLMAFLLRKIYRIQSLAVLIIESHIPLFRKLS